MSPWKMFCITDHPVSEEVLAFRSKIRSIAITGVCGIAGSLDWTRFIDVMGIFGFPGDQIRLEKP